MTNRIKYAVVDTTYNQVISEDSNRKPFTMGEAIEFAQKWRDGLKPEYQDNVRVVRFQTVWPASTEHYVDKLDTWYNEVHTTFNP